MGAGQHNFPVYPQLGTLTDRNTSRRTLGCDIAYVHLLRGFAYWAVVLGAFSRRAIGWAVSMHIDTK